MATTFASVFQGWAFPSVSQKEEIKRVLSLSKPERKELSAAISGLSNLLKDAESLEKLNESLIEAKEYSSQPHIRNMNTRPMIDHIENLRLSHPPDTIPCRVKAFVMGSLQRRDWELITKYGPGQSTVWWTWAEQNLNTVGPLPKKWLERLRSAFASCKAMDGFAHENLVG